MYVLSRLISIYSTFQLLDKEFVKFVHVHAYRYIVTSRLSPKHGHEWWYIVVVTTKQDHMTFKLCLCWGSRESSNVSLTVEHELSHFSTSAGSLHGSSG